MSLPTMQEAIDELGLHVPASRKVACPKHSAERGTPPLHLYEDHFYCFGCGKHGDGIGLIALFTNQDVRRLVAERGEKWQDRDSTRLRLQTKGLSRHDVAVATFRKYQQIHAWFFGKLADVHGDSPSWYYEQAISRWSEVFDDFVDWVNGHNFYEGTPSPAEQERRLRQLKRELDDGLQFELKDARRVRL